MILSSKKFEFEEVDISSSEDDKARMRDICKDPKALPPQITNGDQYCGVSYLTLIFYFFCVCMFACKRLKATLSFGATRRQII